MNPTDKPDTVQCPCCHQETHTTSAKTFELLLIAWETCEHCGEEFSIVDGKPQPKAA